MEEDPTKVPEIPGDDHAEFRDQFVTRHPDVLLPHHREPHKKPVERIQRDFLVHGSVPFYEVGELRTRSETLVQKSGLTKSAEDLLKVVTVDQPSMAVSESQVMDKLHAFFVALEYLNMCDFSVAQGPLKYSAALIEVLTNHKQLWNDARSSAELDKFKQAAHSSAPATPPRGEKKRTRSSSPVVKTARARKNKQRREKQKEALKAARAAQIEKKDPPKTGGGQKLAKDERVPTKEWQAINAFKYSGKRRCPWFNCSLGCRFGDACKNDHLCVECGKPHPWHGNH